MARLKLLVFLTVIQCVFVASKLLVENGVYSRVTVQIQPQKQPENCVEFLDTLEVRPKILVLVFTSPCFTSRDYITMAARDMI